jgi:hypothetical protein
MQKQQMMVADFEHDERKSSMGNGRRLTWSIDQNISQNETYNMMTSNFPHNGNTVQLLILHQVLHVTSRTQFLLDHTHTVGKE